MNSIEKETLESFIPRLKKGDKKAFKLIFDTYFKRLYAFSLQYVEDKYAAEEIVENTLLKLWQKRDKLDKIDNLKSYLYTMVRNGSLDYIKKEKKFIRLDLKKHDAIALKDQFIIEEETYAVLFQALENLPTKCRKVFELSCLEGVKYKDIAEDLQISINTVKSQRARAIELLKFHLKDYPLFQILLAIL
ncbi:RNA polymerase sigma factor [Tamlana sp. I1]|uniref:RNA polymerase sigma factor n=1 Tax=Tamlana sp. I1 TaxID=2762061 RepID=UPI00188F98A5|nr:RNA polymerase sigma-70 factor [Tamlana sp. I1]